MKQPRYSRDTNHIHLSKKPSCKYYLCFIEQYDFEAEHCAEDKLHNELFT